VTIFTVSKQKPLNIMSVYVYSCLSYQACRSPLFCAVLYCHLWPVWLYHIFPHYFTLNNFRKKKLLNIKYVLCFSLQILSETFFILRIIERDITINVHGYQCKVPVMLVRFEWNLCFTYRFSKNPLMSNFMEILAMGADSSMRMERRTDGRTDRHIDVTNLIVAFRSFANAP
jgi:hypothetical protein